MRASVALTFTIVTIGTLLAGCLQTAAPSAGHEAPKSAASAWTTPGLPKVDAKEFIVNHAKFVSTYPQRAGNSDTHKGARDYLLKQFSDAGLIPFRLDFTAGIPQADICGIKLGDVEPTQWVVVGGHYDTTTWDSTAGGPSSPGTMVSQGAYDDGSGTWITVELAKAFAKVPSYYSIIFCAYDGEERGLQGATALRKAFDDSEKFPYAVDGVHAILDIDMFGIDWPVHTPVYITQNNKPLMDKVTEYRKNVLKIPDNMFVEKGVMPVLGSSDYAVWMFDKANPIPGVFYISDFSECGAPTPVADPAPVPGVPCSYPWWHWMDTTTTMQAMAGGPVMSQAGFQTALDLASYTLAIEAQHPEIKLV